VSGCPICGCTPCSNPAFCRLCREADRRLAHERHEIRHVEVRNSTPAVTVEAVLCSIRTRGLAALKEPAVLERLNRCDTAAKLEINKRIERLLGKGESRP
jgi:hypothetical protein